MILPSFITKRVAYLLYINVNIVADLFPGYLSSWVIALKMGTSHSFGNRTYSDATASEQEIKAVRAFYGAAPFQWWTDASQEALVSRLKQNGFNSLCSFPAMEMNIAALKEQPYAPGITVKQLEHDLESLEVWISTVAQSYSLAYDDIKKLVNFLFEYTDTSNLRFYLGFLDGKPVATALASEYDDTICLHWIGTLPELRRQGLGYAVTYQPLIEARSRGLQYAALFASKMGRHTSSVAPG